MPASPARKQLALIGIGFFISLVIYAILLSIPSRKQDLTSRATAVIHKFSPSITNGTVGVKYKSIVKEPDGSATAQATASFPRKDYFQNPTLTGHIQLPVTVFLQTPAPPLTIYERIMSIFTPSIPRSMGLSEFAVFTYPTFTESYKSVLAQLETETPENLLADLSLGLNSLAPTQTKTKGFAQGHLLKAQLLLKANQPAEADKALTTAAPAIQANPTLIPQYQQLQIQIPNPTSPEL